MQEDPHASCHDCVRQKGCFLPSYKEPSNCALFEKKKDDEELKEKELS